MTTLDWIFALIALINVCGAVYWGKKYRIASDRLIQAKDAEIQMLQKHIDILERLNPKVLVEWHESSIKLTTSYTKEVEGLLNISKTKIEKLESEMREKDNMLLEKDNKLSKAKDAHNNLSQVYSKLKLASDQHRLPDLLTVISSVSSSGVLADSTSVDVPKVNPNLIKIWDSGLEIWDSYSKKLKIDDIIIYPDKDGKSG